MVHLLKPDIEHLDGYRRALLTGWSPDNVRPKADAAERLAKINTDPVAFVATLDDPEARGGPITLLDGSQVTRLPGYHRWIWDGEFCGNVGFRWQIGTAELPPHVLGHIGYAVVPWKRGRGYAKEGLRLILIEAKNSGLPYVELTADPGNPASQKVITANGGVLIERFRKADAYGGGDSLRYRILL